MNRSALLLALLLAVASGSEARVYQLRGHVHRGYVAPEQLGWAPAYRTRIRLNGGGGVVEMLESRDSLSVALAQLEEAYRLIGGRVFFYPAGTAAWGVVFAGDHVIRIFAFQAGSDRQTLFMRLDQSEKDFLASFEVPKKHALARVPGHPALRPTYVAVDEGTGLGMQVARVDETPDEVYFYYAQAMEKGGWAPALPLPSHRSEPSGFMLYTRGMELCLVSVQSSGQARESVLTLVHKKLDSGKVY